MENMGNVGMIGQPTQPKKVVQLCIDVNPDEFDTFVIAFREDFQQDSDAYLAPPINWRYGRVVIPHAILL